MTFHVLVATLLPIMYARFVNSTHSKLSRNCINDFRYKELDDQCFQSCLKYYNSGWYSANKFKAQSHEHWKLCNVDKYCTSFDRRLSDGYRSTIKQQSQDQIIGGSIEDCQEKPVTDQTDLSTTQRIYQEQGFLLTKAPTIDDAQRLAERIIGSTTMFSYRKYGVVNERVDQADSNTNHASMPAYGDAPSVPTLPHNEVAYNLKFPAHFIFWMEVPAVVGGITQLWDSVKACGEIQARLPVLWDEYMQYGLEYCTFYPDENLDCGRAVLDAWSGIGIWLYSKSLQKMFGLSHIDALPNSTSPYIVYSQQDCGIQKCTRTLGIVETSHGLACVNQLLIWSPKNFYNYNLTLAMHPFRVQLGQGRTINEEEWRVIYSIYEYPRFQHKLTATELVIVNNIRFAHGRSPYSSDSQRIAKLLLYEEVNNIPN